MANVETTITGGIAHVKLNRPEKLNGLTLQGIKGTEG